MKFTFTLTLSNDSLRICASYAGHELCRDIDAPRLASYLESKNLREVVITSIRRWYSAAKGNRHVIAKDCYGVPILRSGRKFLETVGKDEVLLVARTCRELASELRRLIISEVEKDVSKAVVVFDVFDERRVYRMVSRMSRIVCYRDSDYNRVMVANGRNVLMITLLERFGGGTVIMVLKWALRSDALDDAIAVALMKFMEVAGKIFDDVDDVIDSVLQCLRDVGIESRILESLLALIRITH